MENIKFYDVTLRDGLQSMSKVLSLDEKKIILHDIISNSKVKEIEIGSLVSNKLLPQMNNSIDLYKYAESMYPEHIFYMLIPNKKN
jgi:hydroxymethylglutaryl-CoA lyase